MAVLLVSLCGWNSGMQADGLAVLESPLQASASETAPPIDRNLSGKYRRSDTRSTSDAAQLVDSQALGDMKHHASNYVVKFAGDHLDREPALLTAFKDYLQRHNHTIELIRKVSDGASLVTISTIQAPPDAVDLDLDSLLAVAQQTGLLAYAEPDQHVATTLIPNDRLYQVQWQLDLPDSPEVRAAMNIAPAWDLTQGDTSTVIAVIDTGVRYEHEDLKGRLLPGYDFVAARGDMPGAATTTELSERARQELRLVRANDGDGRDSDATDPGDSVDAELSARMANFDIECPIQESSWHGTAMASLIAANGNDETGLTGVDWNAQILPVRAIGRCGGRRSDLLDAIRWAAGVADPALPTNPTPARIINLSLGIDDICSNADQRAIDAAVAAGAIVVAAVGNLGRNLDRQPSSPAHCRNVIGVTATNAAGARTSYSSFGLDVDIAAPGGEGAQGDNRPILVATNEGYTEAVPGSAYRYTTGTSVAAPLVSGVIGLMLSMNPELGVGEVSALLKSSARRFPDVLELAAVRQDTQFLAEIPSNQVPCTTTECGAGLVDATAAVIAARDYDPNNATPELAAAISDDQPVFTTGGGGGAVLLPLLALLRLHSSRSTGRNRQTQPRADLIAS